ncbi:hypothetical protein SAMN05216169_101424 [Anoxybacillus pushchinoensis]|uniref:Uncharacterized protein n=1 Tax=Anoxybacillus pushchinoensis TaxID=150248 RepID=A0A1I0T6U4_9BACL|nr:hypothetical protein SAMN05216169_101424 [Anoxybacillus pushchinoensis]
MTKQIGFLFGSRFLILLKHKLTKYLNKYDIQLTKES